LELGQTGRVVRNIMEDLPNLEGRVLEMVFREKILAKPPMEFDVAGSVFRNREGIEIDLLLAAEKENRIYAYEFKRGDVNKRIESNRLISKVARLKFKSIRLNNPEITGKVLTTKDI